MKKLKDFFGQRNYYLTLACALLAIVSTCQFNQDAQQTEQKKYVMDTIELEINN